MATRRGFITILGGGTILAAGGLGLAAFPITADPAAAWRDPGAGETDPRRKALSFAILAPNPHNMQPWAVALPGTDEIALHLDKTRLLPATDPFSRQIIMGCGAFLELLSLAAAEQGQRAEITLWPEGEPGPELDDRPVARIRLTADPSVATTALAAAILTRRTNREPYDLARIPGADALERVVAAAALPGLRAGQVSSPEGAAALRDLVFRGWLREAATPAALAESMNVMRIGRAEIARHRDGLVLDGPMIELLKFTPALSREALLDPTSQGNRQAEAIWREMAETAPAFVWIAGSANTRVEQIEAGRAYARMNLAATVEGLAMHPWSMSLQEYPEMADLYTESQAFFGASAAAPVHMLARIGYAKAIGPAPRRGLEHHVAS